MTRRGRKRPRQGRAPLSFSLDYTENVALFHDGEFFAIDLDLGARPFAEQHAVTLLHIERNELAALVANPRANSDDLSLHRLLLGGVGNDDAAGSFLFFFDAPDHDAVLERTEIHGVNLNG